VREFYAPRRNVNGPVAGPNPTTFTLAPILSPTQLQATASGEMLIKASDFKSCHPILAPGGGDQLKKLNADGYEFFHIDSEFSEFSCAMCHTGGPPK
jgi:hypothetical protein